jgi:putative nucleotidyltransferase with HDIG domain
MGKAASRLRLKPPEISPETILSSLAKDFHATTLAMIDEFMGMLDRWTSETRQHSYRVTRMSLLLGAKMGLPELDLVTLGVGALLHDIGKIRVPKEILSKPDALACEELEMMKRHPEFGGEIVERFPSLRFAKDIVSQHQERWDGSGYPKGLKGEEIVFGARIFAVTDSYDAMVTQRTYNDVKTHDQAQLELSMLAGVRYDPKAVHHFLEISKRDLENIVSPPGESDLIETIFPVDHFFRLFASSGDFLQKL